MQTQRIIFTRHRYGAPTQVLAPVSLSPLATFLETDVQDSNTGKELLAQLNQSGQQTDQDLFNGNAHSLRLDQEGEVLIEATVEEEPTTIKFPEPAFASCLEKWIEFLDSPSVLNMIPKF